MIKSIVRDVMFLSMPSQKATPADAAVIRDLKDTLRANQDRCVGMAANMIGERKCILICAIGPGQLVLVNPEIIHREGAYEAKEGCLCHEGERPVKRYRSIRVKYLDEQFQPQERTFLGFPAQIIQHEMDHFEGKLI
jgi:peptide deformylase